MGELYMTACQTLVRHAVTYGHVIFPEAAHQPAPDLAEKPLSRRGLVL